MFSAEEPWMSGVLSRAAGKHRACFGWDSDEAMSGLSKYIHY